MIALALSGDHVSKYRVEVLGPGRQDRFFRTTILFQERLPHLWHRSSSPCLSVNPYSIEHPEKYPLISKAQPKRLQPTATRPRAKKQASRRRG